MDNSVAQKVISLALLILAGGVLKKKFQDPISGSTIKTFILNAALPAAIFLSTVDIDMRQNLANLPAFALAVNLYLMGIGYLLIRTPFLLPESEKTKKRALFLLFPSLAPGLTLYPFIEQFLGKQGLAMAALADMGNKTFVLIGLYTLAIYWHQSNSKATSSTNKNQWQKVILFLLSEPVNIAIFIALGLAVAGLGSTKLPFALTDFIQKMAFCSTPLILFYVGISLKLSAIQFGAILRILTLRAGVGFLFSAAAIALLHPNSLETTILFVSLPQASCSFWPLLHATRINDSENSSSQKQNLFFDTDFGTSLLAMSFPFSILILFIIFSNGHLFFHSPAHLGLLGSLCLGIFGVLSSGQRLNLRRVRMRSLALKRLSQQNIKLGSILRTFILGAGVGFLFSSVVVAMFLDIGKKVMNRGKLTTHSRHRKKLAAQTDLTDRSDDAVVTDTEFEPVSEKKTPTFNSKFWLHWGGLPFRHTTTSCFNVDNGKLAPISTDRFALAGRRKPSHYDYKARYRGSKTCVRTVIVHEPIGLACSENVEPYPASTGVRVPPVPPSKTKRRQSTTPFFKV